MRTETVATDGEEKGEELVDTRTLDRRPLSRPTPHGDKLIELLKNPKLPEDDRPAVMKTFLRYERWVSAMSGLESVGLARLRDLVALLNEYKEFVEVDLIWDSPQNFLYRQKGQLKIDNSILEEWFPWLIDPLIIPELKSADLNLGPAKAFAAAHFQSALFDETNRPGLMIRSKDQDFTIGRQTFVKASFDRNFPEALTDESSTFIAYIAAELKTNLDKTMFQEATATSHDLRIAAPGSHYFLICEYLDMTPISSAGTDIDEVLILRGKRIGSQVRRNFSSASYRQSHRGEYIELIRDSPIRFEVIERFIEHVRAILQNQTNDLSKAVERGYF